MTFNKKVLSMLLACLMITALLCSTAFADAELLLQLNLDELVETTILADAGVSGSSGIVASIDELSGTDINIHGKPQDGSANSPAAVSIYKSFATNLAGEKATPVI